MENPDISVTEVAIEEIIIESFGRGRYEVAVLVTDQGSYFYPRYEYADEQTQEAFQRFEGKRLRSAVLNLHSIVRLNLYFPYFKDMQQMAAVAAESETPYSLQLYNKKAARSEKGIALFLIGWSFAASCLICGLLMHFSVPMLKDEYRRKQNKLRKKRRKQKMREAQLSQNSGQTPKQGKK